ncbi:MAG: hypothetical protein KA765_10020, partial [Thermoflexales bacterium]|nr:hypothetical protein [Thermoflexales bacterium]
MKAQRLSYVWLAVLVGVTVIWLAAMLFGRSLQSSPAPVEAPPVSIVTRVAAPTVAPQNNPPPVVSVTPTALPTIAPAAMMRTVNIVVDDFKPQPYQGEAVYFFNRLDGDRGAVNNSTLAWGNGEVTTTIASGNGWGGVWLSLNHLLREGLPLNFAAILPSQILPDYQSQITGLTVHLTRGTPRLAFRLELKYHGDLQWKHEVELTGGDQTIGLDLPPLGNINELLWVLDRASAGDYAVIDRVSFTATTSITDTATAAFVWSYGQLLNNWNPATGLVRDKAKDPINEFDAIQATGSLAAATASAEQLG